MKVVKNKRRFIQFLICIFIGVMLGRFTTGGFFWAIVFGLTTAFVIDIVWSE